MMGKYTQSKDILAWSEAKLQQEIHDLMDVYGWYRFHDNDSRRNEPGFPDLIALWVEGNRAAKIVAELKDEKRHVTPEQHGWLSRFAACGDPTFVWRPQHWDYIVETITTHRVPPASEYTGWYVLIQGRDGGYNRKVEDTPSRINILNLRALKRLKTAQKRAKADKSKKS